MTRYRFIGDPMERAEGRVIQPGPWLPLPSDEVLARKLMGNGHYEIEGVPIIEPRTEAGEESASPQKRDRAKRQRAAAQAAGKAGMADADLDSDGWE